MATEIKTKLVVSGKMAEFYEYQNPPLKGHHVKEKEERDEIPFEEKVENKISSLRRTRKKLKRLLFCNEDLSRFITLTFACYKFHLPTGGFVYFGNYPDSIPASYSENIEKINDPDLIKDLSWANNEFKKFIKRLRYDLRDRDNPWNHIKPLKYIAVVEFQKRGVVHYHLVVNQYIKKKILSETWDHGFVDVSKIEKRKKACYYLAKYMSKNEANNTKLWGEKLYFTSRNIDRPKVYDNLDPFEIKEHLDKYIEQGIVSGKDPTVFKTKFETEQCGEVKYWKFVFD